MYLLGILCLLSAVVALPTLDQLHTNLPAPPPPPELKPDEKATSSEEKALDFPELETNPDKFDASKIELESNDKVGADKPEDVNQVIQKDSKESKEAQDSKENKESKEPKGPSELKPEESKEEKKEDLKPEESKEEKKEDLKPEESKEEKKEDFKPEESNERYDDDVPVIVQVVDRPKGIIPDWLSDFFSNIHFPWPFRPRLHNGAGRNDGPIYIIRESDFDLY